MEDVLIVFSDSAGKTDECLEALNEMMANIISKQPKFHSATVHVEATTGTVYTIMKWDNATDVIEFRNANRGTALEKYWPKGPLRIVSQFTRSS